MRGHSAGQSGHGLCAAGWRDAKLGELLGITVRGLSAALVVFLAVQGGLTVFSLDDSEPNAYALFFACLAAAVYSDSVWTRVRQSVERGGPTPAPAADPA